MRSDFQRLTFNQTRVKTGQYKHDSLQNNVALKRISQIYKVICVRICFENLNLSEWTFRNDSYISNQSNPIIVVWHDNRTWQCLTVFTAVSRHFQMVAVTFFKLFYPSGLDCSTFNERKLRKKIILFFYILVNLVILSSMCSIEKKNNPKTHTNIE